MSPEEKKAYHKAYRETHKEEQKAYRETHKEERKAYRETHKEESESYQRAYHETHKEERNARNRVRSKAYYKTHKEKRKAYDETHKEERKARNRAAEIQRKYKLTMTEYSILLSSASGHCAICGEPAKLHIDHDHKEGGVRGLLCGSCNRMLGLAFDNPDTLRNAIAYLEKPPIHFDWPPSPNVDWDKLCS